MNKMMMMIVTTMMVLSLGYGVAQAGAAGAMTSWGFATYEGNPLVGTKVMNSGGEMLGTITDFVIDSKGRIVFAILTREFLSEYIAVPFGALSLKPEENIFVLNTTLDELESAPAYSKAYMDNRWTEEVYRYFGQQPYWTEGEEVPVEQILDDDESSPF